MKSRNIFHGIPVDPDVVVVSVHAVSDALYNASILRRGGMLYPVGGAQRSAWQTFLGARLCGPASLLRSPCSAWYIHLVENALVLMSLYILILILSSLRHSGPSGVAVALFLPSPRFQGSQVTIAGFLIVGQSIDKQLQA